MPAYRLILPCDAHDDVFRDADAYFDAFAAHADFDFDYFADIDADLCAMFMPFSLSLIADHALRRRRLS